MDPENSGPSGPEENKDNAPTNEENEPQEENNENEMNDEGNEEGNQNEEENEGEDDEEGNEKKGNYSSKELEDFLVVCNNILLPLEKKEVIKRSLTSFNNNIKNSLDQIVKNFTLQKIELPNESDEMIAKETNIVHALEKLVKNWTDSITKAQDQLTNYPKNITSAMMEIDNRKRAVSNWSILAQQLKSDNI
jgi:hypothetical protein